MKMAVFFCFWGAPKKGRAISSAFLHFITDDPPFYPSPSGLLRNRILWNYFHVIVQMKCYILDRNVFYEKFHEVYIGYSFASIIYASILFLLFNKDIWWRIWRCLSIDTIHIYFLCACNININFDWFQSRKSEFCSWITISIFFVCFNNWSVYFDL